MTALRKSLSSLMAGLALTAAALPALAVDRVSLEFGRVDEDRRVDAGRYGVVAAWDWGVQWLKTERWSLTGAWEVGLNVWDSNRGRSGKDLLVDGSVTPVLRWQRDLSTALPVYFEAGVGLHGYSESKIDNKNLGIPFAFGSHFGLGLRFGPGGQYDLTYRFQHQSNAGIDKSNPGINFHLIEIGYHF